jgi:hypothetical protein
MSIAGGKPAEAAGRCFVGARKRKTAMHMTKRSSVPLPAAMAMLLLCGGLALAQGYPPGVNPSNPQDLTNRSNPMSLTVPGASNPQDLVRSPTPPQVVSPLPGPDAGRSPTFSSSLGHTHTVKPVKKPARHKHGVSEPEG